MRMEEINIGDLDDNAVVFVAGAKLDGTSRPVRVIGKQRHYVMTETVPYFKGQVTYRIDYMPTDLTRRFKSKFHMRCWMDKNKMVDLVFPSHDVSHKQTWYRRLEGDYFEE